MRPVASWEHRQGQAALLDQIKDALSALLPDVIVERGLRGLHFAFEFARAGDDRYWAHGYSFDGLSSLAQFLRTTRPHAVHVACDVSSHPMQGVRSLQQLERETAAMGGCFMTGDVFRVDGGFDIAITSDSPTILTSPDRLCPQWQCHTVAGILSIDGPLIRLDALCCKDLAPSRVEKLFVNGQSVFFVPDSDDSFLECHLAVQSGCQQLKLLKAGALLRLEFMCGAVLSGKLTLPIQGSPAKQHKNESPYSNPHYMKSSSRITAYNIIDGIRLRNGPIELFPVSAESVQESVHGSVHGSVGLQMDGSRLRCDVEFDGNVLIAKKVHFAKREFDPPAKRHRPPPPPRLHISGPDLELSAEITETRASFYCDATQLLRSCLYIEYADMRPTTKFEWVIPDLKSPQLDQLHPVLPLRLLDIDIPKDEDNEHMFRRELYFVAKACKMFNTHAHVEYTGGRGIHVFERSCVVEEGFETDVFSKGDGWVCFRLPADADTGLAYADGTVPPKHQQLLTSSFIVCLTNAAISAHMRTVFCVRHETEDDLLFQDEDDLPSHHTLWRWHCDCFQSFPPLPTKIDFIRKCHAPATVALSKSYLTLTRYEMRMLVQMARKDWCTQTEWQARAQERLGPKATTMHPWTCLWLLLRSYVDNVRGKHLLKLCDTRKRAAVLKLGAHSSPTGFEIDIDDVEKLTRAMGTEMGLSLRELLQKCPDVDPMTVKLIWFAANPQMMPEGLMFSHLAMMRKFVGSDQMWDAAREFAKKIVRSRQRTIQ